MARAAPRRSGAFGAIVLRCCRVAIAGWVVALAGAGGVARAAALEYSAALGCPAEGEFRAAVETRSSTAAARLDDMRVSVQLIEAGATGVLTIVRDGASASREVSGASCEEVVSALALIASLAAPAAPPPATAPSPSRRAPISLGADRVEDAEGESSGATWRWSIGARAGAVYGAVPGAAWAVPVFIELAREGLGSRGPVFRGGAVSATATVRTGADGVASFAWTAGRVEACPLSLAFGPLRTEPCVSFDAGVLEGVARVAVAPAEEPRPWFAPGLALRAGISPIEPVALEVEGRLVFPLVQDTFVFKPATTLHEVGWVAGEVGLGVRLRFW